MRAFCSAPPNKKELDEIIHLAKSVGGGVSQ